MVPNPEDCEGVFDQKVVPNPEDCEGVFDQILYGIQQQHLDRLQRVQNTAARLITRKSMREHFTPILKELHWLPVRLRIVFKLIMFVYKSIHGLSPVYLQEHTALYQPGPKLRSTNKLQLAVPPTSRTTYGDRTFRKAGATLWNALPIDVRGSEDVNTFRSKLKTILFKRAYD
ncbi:uncharacterized protein LOC125381061 [Haliotis rufescens]|uniref:uncharacterized protein LOC125381061 n=1 Tax=Haliotis rufescens TaxID=6454 RepID=UPI00201F0950|nr:uncharacterized protein LOC125381061 [Haliotis rufescens]